MNQPNFTPGPWKVQEMGVSNLWIEGDCDGVHGLMICELNIYDYRGDDSGRAEQMTANAQLIAAAPKLYEACRQALRDATLTKHGRISARAFALLSEALAEAAGQQIDAQPTDGAG